MWKGKSCTSWGTLPRLVNSGDFFYLEVCRSETVDRRIDGGSTRSFILEGHSTGYEHMHYNDCFGVVRQISRRRFPVTLLKSTSCTNTYLLFRGCAVTGFRDCGAHTFLHTHRGPSLRFCPKWVVARCIRSIVSWLHAHFWPRLLA